MQTHFILTQQSLDFFNSHNISFHNQRKARLRVGDHISFLHDLAVEPYVGFHNGNNLFELGYMSYSNSNLPVDIKVGRYCSIAAGVTFISYNHPWKCLSTSIFSHDVNTDLTVRAMKDFLPTDAKFGFVMRDQKDQVVIEHDVWVGQNSSLAAGIRLGTGCIVAANSVVTKDVAPYAIVGGNPAKTIKFRFTDKTIDQLLESKWWEYNFTDFVNLDISTPENFLDGFNKIKSDIMPFNPVKIKISQCQ
jgi:acetyltransferase-like isoleucine patch superfamily enzyme